MTDTGVRNKILEELKVFCDTEIRPLAGEFEEKGAIPRSLIDKMAARGYLGASLPEDYGGLGLDAVDYGLFTEEIGKADSSARSILTVHTSLVGETLLLRGNSEQKAYWIPRLVQGKTIAAFALTEPEVGSDARNVQTTYRKEGSRYIINGSKKWITLGAIADLFLVIAAREEQVTAFLVEREREGITTLPMKGLLAGRAAHIAEITFTNVEVPEKNLLGREGAGFTYIVNTALDAGRYSIAWAGAAIAHEAVDAMVSYARKRRQFGKKLYQFQLIVGIIGDAVTKLHAARALCLRAGTLRREGNNEAVIETTIAKYFTSRAAMEITTDAVQVFGGNGCSNKYPVERLFREAKILEIIEGTSQMQQEMIAHYGLGRHFIPGRF